MRLATLACVLLLPAAFAAGQLSPTALSTTNPGPTLSALQGDTPVPTQGPDEIPGSSDADEPEVDPGLVRSPFAAMRARSTEQLVIEILGAWRLETFQLNASAVDQGDIYGFLTIADEYMSASLHSRSHSSFQDGDELLYFQTTMGRWWFDDAGQFFTQSLIGHSNMLDAEISYEPAGSIRQFTLDMLDEETLVFTRTDQARMLYKRLPLKGDANAKEQALMRRRARARGVDPNAARSGASAAEE